MRVQCDECFVRLFLLVSLRPLLKVRWGIYQSVHVWRGPAVQQRL